MISLHSSYRIVYRVYYTEDYLSCAEKVLLCLSLALSLRVCGGYMNRVVIFEKVWS